jgi:N-succinyldiaminopimelate aminotransferase
VPALARLGCAVRRPEAGFYLWVGTPRGVPGTEYARRLLEEAPALAALPGEWLAEEVTGADGAREHPGAGHVRFALVPPLERCREAAARLAAWS